MTTRVIILPHSDWRNEFSRFGRDSGTKLAIALHSLLTEPKYCGVPLRIGRLNAYFRCESRRFQSRLLVLHVDLIEVGGFS